MATIWQQQPRLEQLKALGSNTLVEHLGIEFLELGEDWIKARMPVDRRTHQPHGILHGGASVALAETLGSVAANLCVDSSRKRCVGLEINANHVRAVRAGYVVGIARPLHLGAATQVWDIRIATEAGKAVCISRLTLAVLDAER